MPAQGVLRQNCLHIRIQTIETATHIHRYKRYEDTGCRRNTQHRVSSISFIKSDTGIASRHRIVSPDEAISSIAHVPFALIDGGITVTSQNLLGAGSLEEDFVFLSHQVKVDIGMPRFLQNAFRLRPLCRN
jgi:hypothetical protein